MYPQQSPIQQGEYHLGKATELQGTWKVILSSPSFYCSGNGGPEKWGALSKGIYGHSCWNTCWSFLVRVYTEISWQNFYILVIRVNFNLLDYDSYLRTQAILVNQSFLLVILHLKSRWTLEEDENTIIVCSKSRLAEEH